MDIGNRILLLRYSDFHGVDTIAEHKKVISSKGHCWWAKIGKQPSEKYLKSFLLQEEKIVLLYTAGRLFKCRLGSVLRERPSQDYPKYYERDIFGDENEPSVYFELLSLEEIEISFLDDYLICSSGKEALYRFFPNCGKTSDRSWKKIQIRRSPRSMLP